MHHHRPPAEKLPSSSAPEPTVRRVKGSGNLSASICNFEPMLVPGLVPESPQIAIPHPCTQSLTPEPLRIRKMNPNITPMTRPSNSQDLVLSKVAPKPLRAHKPLPEIPHPEPESIETQRPQVPEPQITSTRRAIQAGEHTLELALRPTQRGPRRPATEQTRPLCSPKAPNPAPNRHLREYKLPRAPSWEHRRQMGHDLGGIALPPALPPQRKAWKKTGRTLFERQKLLLRNLSKRLRGVQEALIPSSPNESFVVTRPLERDLVLVMKNSSLQMEDFSLKEHIDLLEWQESSTQRIDLQELLESEREKVKLL